MSNFISLDQYRAMIKRNILSEPQMLVKNQTQPRGQIVFQCPGDNFQMKDIIIPATPNAVDLTQQAPLENLLACSQLKSLIQVGHVALLNPDDMPQPGEDIPQPSLSQPPVAGALSVDGTTIPNATVIVEQNGNVWTGTSNGAGAFTVDVSGLQEGAFSITVTADGFTPARYSFVAGPQPLQPMPEPVVRAVFKETTVSGTTVANANIVVAFSGKSFTGQADDQGAFSVAVDALPFDAISLHFEADGYLPKDVSVNAASIPGLAQIDSAAFLSTELSGKASPNAQVEILIDGQANQFTDADASGDWIATVGAIKGAVSIRSLEVEGYDEATATMQPTKLQFGAITVDDADAFGENRTVVHGSIAGLNVAATDIAVTVTVQAGTYEGTVDLGNGTFNITGVDAKAGVGSTGVVNLTSAFYEDGSTSFNILEEFAAPTVDQTQDGQSAINGTTSPSATVKITMAGETKTASSNAQGQFTVSGFTNVTPGNIHIELTKAGYLDAAFDVDLVVLTNVIEDKIHDGQSVVTGHATPGSTVSVSQGSAVGDAQADASTGAFTVNMSSPLYIADGQVTITVTRTGYKTFTDHVNVVE